MQLKGAKSKSIGMLILFLVVGAALGGMIGEGLATSSFYSEYTAFLSKPYLLLDLPPVTLNLHICRLVLGFSLSPTLASILGVIVAFILYRRM